jgi:alpha-D-ribose 1-methylphosphonate 5-triphosphate synthase subunit PhnL
MIGYSETDRHPLRWASGHLKPQGGWVSSVLQVCYWVNLAFSFVFAKGGRICLVSISFTKPSPAQTGQILKENFDVTTAKPVEILALQYHVPVFSSQLPRGVRWGPTLYIAAELLLQVGTAQPKALTQIAKLLAQLTLPERLRQLSPTRCFGGELPRDNLGRGYAYGRLVRLPDKPNASLAATNRDVTFEMILDAAASGVVIICFSHDQPVQQSVCCRFVDEAVFSPVAA